MSEISKGQLLAEGAVVLIALALVGMAVVGFAGAAADFVEIYSEEPEIDGNTTEKIAEINITESNGIDVESATFELSNASFEGNVSMFVRANGSLMASIEESNTSTVSLDNIDIENTSYHISRDYDEDEDEYYDSTVETDKVDENTTLGTLTIEYADDSTETVEYGTIVASSDDSDDSDDSDPDGGTGIPDSDEIPVWVWGVVVVVIGGLFIVWVTEE